MAINAGANVSKLVGYAVLGPQPGVNVTKLVAYAVLSSPNITPPSWGTLLFGTGVVGVSYASGWDMPSAAPPVTYSVVAGALPPGLALVVLGGNQAAISGIPTLAGTYSFTLRATNAFGSADQPATITIVAGSGGGAWTWIA